MASMAIQARDWLQKRGKPATTAQIRRGLKIKLKEVRRIRQLSAALKYLHHIKKITRTDKGIYQYKEKPYTPPPLLAIIWRAIRNERQFTIADIQLISGGRRSYVASYIYYLIKTGYLVKTTRRKGRKSIYGITDQATPTVQAFVNGGKQKERKQNA